MKSLRIYLFHATDRKILWIFIPVLLGLVLFVLVLLKQRNRQAYTQYWVAHTNLVIKKTDTSAAYIAKSDAALRAYVVTKDGRWLNRLAKIQVNLQQVVSDLQRLTIDNPLQVPNMQKLDSLRIKKKRFQLLVSSGTLSPNMVIEKLRFDGEGPKISNDIDSLLQIILKIEDGLLTIRIAQNEKSFNTGIFISLTGSSLAFLIVLWVLSQLNRDIMLRRKAEKEAIDNEIKYRTLIENAGVVMYTTDATGQITFTNNLVTDLTGFLPEELEGKHFTILLNEDKREAVLRFYITQFEKKLPATQLEFEIRTKTGQIKWVEQSTQLVYTKTIVTGFQCMVTDITEKKLVQNELSKSEFARKENEYRLQAILDNSTALIYIKDTEGRYVMANKKFVEFLGVTEEQVIGHTDYDFNPPVLADHYKKMDDTVFATRKPIESEETLVTPEGNKNLLLLKFPLLTKEGNLLGISGIATDITEKVQARLQHLAAIQTAETAQQIQEQFLANMSHEVRTPMNGIQGMTKLLLDTELTPEQQNFTNMINRSLNNLTVIVNNVLDFSNIKTGNLVLDRIAFILTDILDEVKKQFTYQVANKALDFQIHIDAAVPAVLTGDAYKLKQILSNLIGNAIKFTHEGSIRLVVNVQSQKEQTANILFTLSDTGIGIPEDKLQTIFESFAQANKEISRGYGGSGLGLSISKGLIELQGGSISVKSKPGQGSVFSFTIPLGVKKEKEAVVSNNTERLMGKRFLVVEDNLVNQRLISFVLQKVGIVVEVASNGREAVMYFENGNTCDLVIMDLQMPVMDGYEATTYIRQRLKLTVPIIAMTATALKEDQDRSREVGMNDFIIKPFDFKDLYKRLMGILYDEDPGTVGGLQQKAGSEKLFDLALLEELDDKDSLLDVLSMFFENTPRDVKELEQLYLEKKMEPLSKLAHKIKGVVSILQSVRLTELLKKIELRAKEPGGDVELEKDIKEVLTLFTLLETQLHIEWERINKEV